MPGKISRKSNKNSHKRSRSRVGWIGKAFGGFRESKNLMACFKDKSVAVVDPRTIVLMKKGLRFLEGKFMWGGLARVREKKRQKIFFCSYGIEVVEKKQEWEFSFLFTSFLLLLGMKNIFVNKNNFPFTLISV